ncbi:hypothetical protein Trydic_g97 [Trypoxylus dichotomus]
MQQDCKLRALKDLSRALPLIVSDSGVLVLVVSVVVLTVTLGLVTCVLSHYRGGTAANSHDVAQTPTTAPVSTIQAVCKTTVSIILHVE